MFKNTAIVGIFDRFHEGHKFAIREAFKRGENVHLLFLNTGDKFTHPDKTIDLVEPLAKRKKTVKNFVDSLDKSKRIKYYGEKDEIGLPPVFGWSVLRDCEDLGWIQCESDIKGYTPFSDTINYIRTKAYGLSPMIPLWIPAITDEEGNKVSSSKLRAGEEVCRIAQAK